MVLANIKVSDPGPSWPPCVYYDFLSQALKHTGLFGKARAFVKISPLMIYIPRGRQLSSLCLQIHVTIASVEAEIVQPAAKYLFK